MELKVQRGALRLKTFSALLTRLDSTKRGYVSYSSSAHILARRDVS